MKCMQKIFARIEHYLVRSSSSAQHLLASLELFVEFFASTGAFEVSETRQVVYEECVIESCLSN